MSSRDYFRGKRVAVIGLGPHGEMIPDIAFLVDAGALVTVADLRVEARVKEYLPGLRELGLANLMCGSIPIEDLPDMDIIVLSHEYPRDSSFLKHVRRSDTQIEYPESIFFRLAPPITLVGVIGTCGKSTVVSMLFPMLVAAPNADTGHACHIIDPERDAGILSHLKTVKSGDVVLVRIESMVARELHALRLSPHVAIFTTLPPSDAYTDSPFEIVEYQTYNNFIVGSDEVVDATHVFDFHAKAKMFRTRAAVIPRAWQFTGRGPHDRDNAALALEAARILKVPDAVIRETLAEWKPLKGRLEPIKKIKQVEFYNDSASISPYATLAGVQSLAGHKNVVLVFGGVDCGNDYKELYAALPQYIHTLILIPGSGTMRQRAAVGQLDDVEIKSAMSVEEAAELALEEARKGDKVLFSPGFQAGGFDRSRTERGERFVKAVRAL